MPTAAEACDMVVPIDSATVDPGSPISNQIVAALERERGRRKRRIYHHKKNYLLVVHHVISITCANNPSMKPPFPLPS